MRRGKECSHLIFGEDIAINAGNAMYFAPLKVLQHDRDATCKSVVRVNHAYCSALDNLQLSNVGLC